MYTHRPIGFNAHLSSNYIRDLNQLYDDVEKVHPASLLLYIDNMNDSHRLYAFRNTFPDITMFVRVFHPQDGMFHYAGNDGGYVMSPEVFLEKYQAFGKNGFVLQVMNEPSGHAEQERLVRWLTRLIQILPSNVSVALPAFGDGHPNESFNFEKNRREVEPVFDPLWMALYSKRSQVYLNVHEYLPFDKPWTVGRFEFIFNRMRTLRLNPELVRFVVTEFGADTTGQEDQLNGYRSRGWSAKKYFQECNRAIDQVYSPYLQRGQLLGLHIFSYGNSGGWENFDIQEDREFISELSTLPKIANPMRFLSMTDARWQRGIISAVEGSTNVRKMPTTLHNAPLGRLRHPTLCFFYPDPVYRDWAQVRLDNGLYGWVARRWVSFKKTV